MHGASVHFVTAELDGGPIIAQVQIPVHAGDTPDALAGRLLDREHRLLVACVAGLASGRVALSQAGVCCDGAPLAAPLRLDADGALIAP